MKALLGHLFGYASPVGVIRVHGQKGDVQDDGVGIQTLIDKMYISQRDQLAFGQYHLARRHGSGNSEFALGSVTLGGRRIKQKCRQVVNKEGEYQGCG